MTFKSLSLPVKAAVGVVVLAAATALLVYSLSATVKVAPVVRGKAVNAVPGSVTVQAEYQMDIKTEATGRVVKSDLVLGQKMAAGAFLLQLDTQDLDISISQVEKDRELTKKRTAIVDEHGGSSTVVSLATAQEDLKNSERLFKAGKISETDIQRQRHGVQQIEQNYELEKLANEQTLVGYETSLAALKRQRDKMTITAPFEGVVSAIDIRPGDLITVSGNPIATLISTSRTVEARISEENFANIRVGQSASVRFLGYGDSTYNAKVAKVLPVADAATQRYVVYLDVDIPAELLVPGITGEVSIVVGEHQNALIIPRRALFGSSVYAVRKGRVELREVRTDYVGLNVVEVTDGLKEGELVIVDDLDRVRAGDRVRTQLEKTP